RHPHASLLQRRRPAPSPARSYPTRRPSDRPPRPRRDIENPLREVFVFVLLKAVAICHQLHVFLLEAVRDILQKDQAQNHAFIFRDRKSTRLNSSHVSISYAVFCLKIKTQTL